DDVRRRSLPGLRRLREARRVSRGEPGPVPGLVERARAVVRRRGCAAARGRPRPGAARRQPYRPPVHRRLRRRPALRNADPLRVCVRPLRSPARRRPEGRAGPRPGGARNRSPRDGQAAGPIPVRARGAARARPRRPRPLRQLSLLALQHQHGRAVGGDVSRRVRRDPGRTGAPPWDRLISADEKFREIDVTKSLFGEVGGVPVEEIVIRSKAGATAKILTWGAVVRELVVPASGGRQSVTLGLNTIDDYVAHSPHFGAVPGRFANRIANGRFTLDGVEHTLDKKPGDKHTLHGGPKG